MQLCKLFKFYSNHFLISLSISDLEILAKRVSVLYAVVHGGAKEEDGVRLLQLSSVLAFAHLIEFDEERLMPPFAFYDRARPGPLF